MRTAISLALLLLATVAAAQPDPSLSNPSVFRNQAQGAPAVQFAPVLRFPVESYTTALPPSECTSCPPPDRYAPETYLASGRYAHTFLLLFVGDTGGINDPSIYPWTKNSATPDPPPPWDYGGDSPQKGNALWQHPWVTESGEPVPGWVIVPVEWRYLLNPAGEWVRDEHMRVSITMAPRGCGAPRPPECPGRVLVRNTDLSLIPTVPTLTRRREIVR